MATVVQTKAFTTAVRVALIIEGGRIRPVWFEECGKRASDRVFVQRICQTWSHMEGTDRILTFAVWDGSHSYRLSLNTKDFTWSLGIAVESPF
jgi:hypothetical protein